MVFMSGFTGARVKCIWIDLETKKCVQEAFSSKRWHWISMKTNMLKGIFFP